MDAEPDGEEPESFYVDAVVKLLASVVITAAKDARQGNREAMDFLERAGVKNVDDVRSQLSDICKRI